MWPVFSSRAVVLPSATTSKPKNLKILNFQKFCFEKLKNLETTRAGILSSSFRETPKLLPCFCGEIWRGLFIDLLKSLPETPPKNKIEFSTKVMIFVAQIKKSMSRKMISTDWFRRFKGIRIVVQTLQKIGLIIFQNFTRILEVFLQFFSRRSFSRSANSDARSLFLVGDLPEVTTKFWCWRRSSGGLSLLARVT